MKQETRYVFVASTCSIGFLFTAVLSLLWLPLALLSILFFVVGLASALMLEEIK